MKPGIVIFEDSSFNNFLPLSYTRPVFELKCGTKSLRKRIEDMFTGFEFSFMVREVLKGVFLENNPACRVNSFEDKDTIFINGRLLAEKSIAKIMNEENECLFVSNGSLVAVRLNAGNKSITSVTPENISIDYFKNLPRIEIDAEIIDYPWDIVSNNGKAIMLDWKEYEKRTQVDYSFRSVDLVNKENIYFGKNVSVMPQVVLDASHGPIIIEDNVTIMSHTTILGPVFINHDSLIKINAAIYHNTSIGEFCKVGGEVEESIIHSYSNKQHEGFLGHSYLGQWVNIGASTNNSDLKNNYGNISVHLNNRLIDTGLQFVGLIMGDHSKTAINTMFNTGTIVGISCNIFGTGFPKRYIPSFTFGGVDMMRTNSIEKSIEIAKLVMSRRNITLTNAEEQLLRVVYSMTEKERN